MPYIPSDILWKKISSLVQGFFIAHDPKYVICIKLEPTIINSIIDGCLIEVGIVKEYYGLGLTMLLIEDIPQQPFFVIGKNFSTKSEEFKSYDKVVIDLFEQKEIILALFNLDSAPIYSRVLKPTLDKTKKELSEWLKSPTSPHKDLRLFDPKDIFTIDVNNYADPSPGKSKNMIIIKPEPFAFEKGEYEPITTVENETEEGKHGYSQEFAIRNILIENFEISKSYFESPKKHNNEELTDSVLILENSLLLIESKFVISEKQNKKNQALKKAINQLAKAKIYILENGFNSFQLNERNQIIEICIVDTKFIHRLTKFPGEILPQDKLFPIIFTVSSFTQFIGLFRVDYQNGFKPYFEQKLLEIWSERGFGKLTIVNPF